MLFTSCTDNPAYYECENSSTEKEVCKIENGVYQFKCAVRYWISKISYSWCSWGKYISYCNNGSDGDNTENELEKALRIVHSADHNYTENNGENCYSCKCIRAVKHVVDRSVTVRFKSYGKSVETEYDTYDEQYRQYPFDYLFVFHYIENSVVIFPDT